MRIYLDACCLCRPFDDRRQDRIRLEAEAVLALLAQVQEGKHELTSSETHLLEIEKIRSREKRSHVLDFLRLATQHVRVGRRESRRATQLSALGFGAHDALHLACAETARCRVFLTTDDRLLRRARRHRHILRVRVLNPIEIIELDRS